MHVRLGLAGIRAAQSVLSLREATMEAFAGIGFPSAYFVTPVTSDRRFGRVHSANNMADAWCDAYPVKLRYEDPLPDLALRLCRPLRWSEARSIEPPNRHEEPFYAFLSGLGFEDGLALPTYGPGARTGFVGLPAVPGAPMDEDTAVIAHAIAQMSFLRYCELIETGDGVAVRRLGGVAEQLDQPALDLLAHDVLPPAGLVVDVRPVEPDDIAQQALGETVLAHHVDGLLSSVVGQLEAAVLRDDDETVALHTADRLRHRGAGVAEALGDARTKGRDALFLEFEDGAQIHLGGVDEVGHEGLFARETVPSQPIRHPVAERHGTGAVGACALDFSPWRL